MLALQDVYFTRFLRFKDHVNVRIVSPDNRFPGSFSAAGYRSESSWKHQSSKAIPRCLLFSRTPLFFRAEFFEVISGSLLKSMIFIVLILSRCALWNDAFSQ
jgi:hypothetical protein